MILILLVIPVYVLFRLSDNNDTGAGRTNALSIGVLLVFTLAFLAVLSLFTRAKRHEKAREAPRLGSRRTPL